MTPYSEGEMDCAQLRDELLGYLNEALEIRETEGRCSVVLPIKGRDGDLVEAYIRYNEELSTLIITDETDTISSLFLNGVDVDSSENRRTRLNRICNFYEIKNQDNELLKYTDIDRVAQDIVDFLSGLLSIQYLQYTSRPRKVDTFAEDIEEFLDGVDPHYTKDAEVTGASGEKVSFDFGYLDYNVYVGALHASSNYLAKEKTLTFCMGAVDVKEEDPGYSVIAFYDDSEDDLAQCWSSREMHYMEKYLDRAFAWTARHEFPSFLP